jgi:hypothetical protein
MSVFYLKHSVAAKRVKCATLEPQEKNKMKITMLSLMCLMLSGGQAVLAQSPTSNEEVAVTVKPDITGLMRRDFVKRIAREPGFMRLKRYGSEKSSELLDTFNNANVTYDGQTRQWNIFTQARNSKWNRRKKSWDMWIKYNEETGLLVISTTKENRNQWTLKKDPSIRVTIAEDKSMFHLEFLKNFEGTNDAGYHYNWMQGSRLFVTRGSPSQ